MISRFDVAVVGGGPAGTSLAIGLSGSGHRVLVVESSTYDRPRVGESLVPDVQGELRRLGAWDAFLATGPLPSLGTRSAWDGESGVVTHSHLVHPYQHGWHVDRAALDQALADVAASAGAELVVDERVVGVDWTGSSWRLTARSGWTCDARVVVDATGRSARIANLLGARRHLFDQLVAVGGVVAGDDRGERHVLVEAVDDGWWYSCPLPGGGLMALLMTDTDICAERRLTDRRNWLASLRSGSATHQRCNTAGGAPHTIRVNSAHSVRHRRVDRRPWLAVGDAALAVDPLSGSGVWRALRTADSARRAVEHTLLTDDTSSIDRFDNERDRECHAYLHERLDYYAAAQARATPFWTRRHSVAARAAHTQPVAIA